MDKQRLVFEQLKAIKDIWVEDACDNLGGKTDISYYEVEDEYKLLRQKIISPGEKEAYEKVVNNLIEGVMHSSLVMMDGGDDLADSLYVDLIERDIGESLSGDRALHEEFMGYLL